MQAGEPFVLRRINVFVVGNAAHAPPHPRIEHVVAAHVVIPHALPRRFQRMVPATLARRQRSLGALLPVDIDDLDDDINGPTGGIRAQQRGGDQHPERLAILVVHPAFEPQIGAFTAHHLLEMQHHRRAVLGVDRLLGGSSEALVGSEAQHRLVGAVDVDGPLVDADQRHADGGALHDLAQQCAALVEAKQFRVDAVAGLFRWFGHASNAGSQPLRSGLFRARGSHDFRLNR